MPRPREHLITNLETLYREAWTRAQESQNTDEMARLDFNFRRDQLYLEAVLDARDAVLAQTAQAAQAAAAAAAAAAAPAGKRK